MRRHPLVAFFVLAYLLNFVYSALLLLAIQLGVLSSNSLVANVAGRLPSFAPAVAALIVTGVIAGRGGVVQLLRRLVQWRVPIYWYFIVLFGLPIALILGAAVIYGGAPLRAAAGQWQTAILLYLPTVAVAALVTGIGEETGWRGFALPRLQSRYGAILATLILGSLWGLWHLPNVLFEHLGPQTFALFLLETLGDAFILTWVYNGTRGSLLLVVLLHAVQNKSFGIVGLLAPDLSKDQLYVLVILVDAAALLLILLLTRGTLSYRQEPAALSEPLDRETVTQGPVVR